MDEEIPTTEVKKEESLVKNKYEEVKNELEEPEYEDVENESEEPEDEKDKSEEPKEPEEPKCVEESLIKEAPEVEVRSFVCENESAFKILNCGQLKTVPVLLYGQTCETLLDSGSRKNYIGNDLFKELSSEKVFQIENKTIFLEFTIANICFSDEFTILPNTPSYSLFLGESFFTKHKIIFDVRKDKLIHHGGNEGTFWEIYFRKNECRRVLHEVSCILGEDFDKEKGMVNVEVSDMSLEIVEHEELVCEPLNESIFSFVPGIINDRSFKVRVINPKELPVLKKGEKIGIAKTLLSYSECFQSFGEECKVFVNSGDPADLDLAKDEWEKISEIPNKWTREEFKEKVICNHLNEQQQEELFNLLWEHSGMFTINDQDLKQPASLTKFQIELLPGATPVYHKPRHFNPIVTNAIHDEIEKLISSGIIERSKSEWNSPLVPIFKSDSSLRLAQDYRSVNKKIKGDTFPLPNLQSTIYNLQGSQLFSSIDLCRAYYQIEIDENSRDITSFSVPGIGSFRFKRLSFGLKTAPSCFQREMELVLEEFLASEIKNYGNEKNGVSLNKSLKSKLSSPPSVHCYLDDILLSSENFETHLKLLAQVLSRLEERGLKAKLSKCTWVTPEIEFLGHVVSKQGLQKNKSYFEKVKQYEVENIKTIGELHTFLGLTLWQRKFMRRAAEIAKPLTEIIGQARKTEIDWDNKKVQAFKNLKSLALENNTLYFPDYNSEHKLIVATDASGEGAGAELMQHQVGEDGQLELRTIALASMAFSKAQKNYSTIERELAAIRWGIKTFKSFLLGIPFILQTDHQPLKYLYSLKNVDSRLARTLTDLLEFDFEIEYISGKDNIIADGLSRNVVNKEIVVEDFGGDYTVIHSPKGGPNCMIDCLLFQIKKDHTLLNRWKTIKDKSEIKDPTLFLRELLVKELLKSPKKYKIEGKKKIISSMVDPEIAPSFDLLNAFGELFQCIIYVLVHKTFLMKFPSQTKPLENPPVIYLFSLSGGHVELIEPNEIEKCNSFVEHRVVPYGSKRLNNDFALDLRPDSVLPRVGSFKETPTLNLFTKQNEDSVTYHFGDEGFYDYNSEILNCNHVHNRISKIYLTINDLRFCSILDSGSTVNLISEASFEKIQKMKNGEKLQLSHPVTMVGYTGTSLLNDYVKIDIKIENIELNDVPFAIVKNDIFGKHANFCVIIGIQTLRDLETKLDYDHNLVVMKNSVFSFIPQTSLNNCSCGDCHIIDLKSSFEHLTDPRTIRDDQNNKVLKKLKEYINSGGNDKLPQELKRYERFYKRIMLENDIMYFQDAERLKVPVVSFKFTIDMVLQTHNSMSHIGRDKLFELCRQQIFNPDLRNVISDVSTTCPVCQLNKIKIRKYHPPIIKIQTYQPYQLVALDMLQLPISKSGNPYLLTVIDHNSKFLHAIPVRNKKSETIALALKKLLPTLLKIPNAILTDRGLEFTGRVEELLSEYNIKHLTTSSYTAWGNGCCEKANKTISDLLRNTVQDPKLWEEQLAKAISVYNNTHHAELNMSPAVYVLNIKHEVNDRPLIPRTDFKFWVRGHEKFRPFDVGELVIKKIIRTSDKVAHKLDEKYSGPYEIVKVFANNLTYEIKSCNDGKIIQVHYHYLRPWKVAPEYLKQSKLYGTFYSDFITEIYGTEFTICDPVHQEEPEEQKNERQPQEPDYYEICYMSEGGVYTPEVSPIILDFSEIKNHSPIFQTIIAPVEDVARLLQDIFTIKTKYETLLMNVEGTQNEGNQQIATNLRINLEKVCKIEQKLKFTNSLDQADLTNLITLTLELTEFTINIMRLTYKHENSAVNEFLQLCEELSVDNISATRTTEHDLQAVVTAVNREINLPPSGPRRLRADAQICKQFSSSHIFHPGRLTRHRARELKIVVSELSGP